MTADELYQAIIDQLPIKELHPLHEAMMKECCENTVNNSQQITDNGTLILAAQVAFLTCNSTLKGTLEASFKMTNADQVTFNYRNQKFIILKNSPILK